MHTPPQTAADTAMPKPAAQPEILSPGKGNARFSSANQLFRNENLDMLARLLDDCFRIPGTSIRFGLDGIIGLIPGLGDVLAGLASSLLVIAAWARGVPYVILARMVVNLGIDVLVGSIPILGDAFDVAWKANRRNYALITRHLASPRHNHWRDWFFLGGIALVLLLTFTLPIVLLVTVIDWYLLKK